MIYLLDDTRNETYLVVDFLPISFSSNDSSGVSLIYEILSHITGPSFVGSTMSYLEQMVDVPKNYM